MSNSFNAVIIKLTPYCEICANVYTGYLTVKLMTQEREVKKITVGTSRSSYEMSNVV